MALTKKILEDNKILEGLSDEQKLAIITLSENDENAIFRARFSEVYRQLDDTILESTGITRNGDEKTYNYLARAAKEYASKFADYDTIKGENGTLNAKVAELEEKIAKGSLDAESMKAFAQAKADLEAVKKQYADLKGEYDTAKGKYESDLFGIRVDGIIDSARSSLKFSKDANEAIVNLAVKEAVSKLKGYNPAFIDDGNGGQVLVFRNAEGATMNNAENQLKPYTAKELLAKELSSYGVLETEGRKGSGSSATQHAPAALTGFTTQAQFYAMAGKMLSAKGLVYGSLEYQNALDSLYAENNVNSLPLGSDD